MTGCNNVFVDSATDNRPQMECLFTPLVLIFLKSSWPSSAIHLVNCCQERQGMPVSLAGGCGSLGSFICTSLHSFRNNSPVHSSTTPFIISQYSTDTRGLVLIDRMFCQVGYPAQRAAVLRHWPNYPCVPLWHAKHSVCVDKIPSSTASIGSDDD